MQKNVVFFFCLFSITCLHAQVVITFQPTATAQIFAEGIVSDGLSNRDMAISKDGKQLLYTIQQKNGTYSCIMHMEQKNGKWSLPEVAFFSGVYNDLEPAFSPDGKRLYFTSNRPLTDTGKINDYDIWWIDKTATGWSAPVNAGKMINTEADEFYPSVARNGNLYFTRNTGSAAKEDILCSRFVNGNYQVPEALPASVNSPGYEFNAFIDPDEAFIIFSGYKRKDDMGGGDLYISFKENGIWQDAKNMGALVNSASLDYCPFVSPDKKIFYFTSSRTGIAPPLKNDLRKDLKKRLGSAGNGNDDIYSISMDTVLKTLRN